MTGNQAARTTAFLGLKNTLPLVLTELIRGAVRCDECEECPPSGGCPIWSFDISPDFRALANQAWREVREQHPNLSYRPAERALLRLFVERFIELIKAEAEELRRQLSERIDGLFKSEQGPK